MISCSLGDDNVTSYEDTCSFTCNTGYELTGSDTRTCQSDGSWSGTNTMCRRGINAYSSYVHISYMFDIKCLRKRKSQGRCSYTIRNYLVIRI